MNREEFVKKFKVGDKIQLVMQIDSPKNDWREEGVFVEIAAIGRDNFFAITSWNNDEIKYCWKDGRYELYEPPKKMVKKWLWVIRYSEEHDWFLTSIFYSTKEEVEKATDSQVLCKYGEPIEVEVAE